MRYFEDLKIGDFAVSEIITLTSSKIIAFANEFDPATFHTDEEKAKNSIFGSLVASGLHTMAIFRKLEFQINSDLAVICGVEWQKARFIRPVFAGDQLHATTEVVEKRLSESKKDRGLITFRGKVMNQNDQTVLDVKVIVLVECRDNQKSSTESERT